MIGGFNLTIDLENDEQYRKFVKDIADAVAGQSLDFYDDLTVDVADEIVARYKDKLANAILDRLIKFNPQVQASP